MTIIHRLLDAIAAILIATTLRLSLACYRWAEAARWRRGKLRALDQRRRS